MDAAGPLADPVQPRFRLASCRSLPRPMYAVGVWYLAAGRRVPPSPAVRIRCHRGPWPYRSASANCLMAAILYRHIGENNVEG